MTKVQSMTGFARITKNADALNVTCEMRSVNGKSLDIRLRLPSGFEHMETAIKKQIAGYVSRGNVQVSVTLESAGQASTARIDEAVFASVASKAFELAEKHKLAPPTTDGLLGVRGVVLADDAKNAVPQSGDAKQAADAVLVAAIDEACAALMQMREVEGASLEKILSGQLSTIEQLVIDARDDKANHPDAIMARLQTQLSALLSQNGEAKLDADRLHAEAALLATKADIREEIDRLDAHVSAARTLLKGGGAIGRKLDFLSQEFNRETNTICSKSASATLTTTGLALKAVIDQFREQVQNLQ